jgi:hypothetical protein
MHVLMAGPFHSWNREKSAWYGQSPHSSHKLSWRLPIKLIKLLFEVCNSGDELTHAMKIIKCTPVR